MQKPKHILWLPTGGQIGDALMMLSVLAEFLEREPEGKVTYLARRNAPLISDLASAYSRICVMQIPKNPFNACMYVAGLFLRGNYIVVVPPTPGKHPREIKIVAALFKLMPGNTVIGMRDNGTWQPFNRMVDYDLAILNIDNLRRLLRMGAVTVAPEGASPRLLLDTKVPQAFPYVPGSYIVIHPFPTLPSKTLPLHRWKALLVELARQYPSVSFVITGSKENASLAQEMSADIPRTQVATGLPILEVAGIIRNSALYIGVDTGITHLAGVLHHKSVVLAQRSSPTWLLYYNPNAKVLVNTTRCTCDVNKESCFVQEDGQKYYRCLYDIIDKTILDAIHESFF
jgi:ADP-heptose:LPS heptosyltransferase